MTNDNKCLNCRYLYVCFGASKEVRDQCEEYHPGEQIDPYGSPSHNWIEMSYYRVQRGRTMQQRLRDGE